VSGELSAGAEAEARAHARQCARCRHELAWLETERRLFRQRAGRDEVTHLWKGVARRSGLVAPRRWPGLVAGVAAALLLVVAAGSVSVRRPPGQVDDALAALQSEPLESAPAALVGGEGLDAVCSRLPTGLGFHCGPAVPASFLASR
jgi:anti-sigma factor RsiW